MSDYAFLPEFQIDRDIRRYLTKLCDQIVCLLSSEHSRAIVWDDENDDDALTDPDDDDSGRLYDFVVAKTNDQEENVVARPGFRVLFFSWNPLFTSFDSNPSHRKVDSSLLVHKRPSSKILVDRNVLSPRLLHGETTQGFMTAKFKRAETLTEPFSQDHQSSAQIRLFL